MRRLVIAAHPDDEILGMGGTIKKLTKKGDKVKIAILATGITARRSNKFKNSTKYETEDYNINEISEQIETLRKEARQAAEIVGVKDVEFFDYPDNEMDLISNLQVTKTIEKLIEDFKPKTLYTHSNFDINIDHRIIHNATLTATRPNSNTSVNEVIAFEIPSSTEWYFPTQFSPNLFVDISKELPTKLKAMKKYSKEIRQFPHPRSVEALEAVAKRWGSVSGFRAAEAFTIIRELKSDF